MTFCSVSPTPPASVQWAELWQSGPTGETLAVCMRCLFSSIRFLQVRTVSSIMFLSVLPLPPALLFVLTFPPLHLYLFFLTGISCLLSISASLFLSPGVELNLGHLSLTDWLICRFCQLRLNEHEPFCTGWEPVSGWLFRRRFIILHTSSPSQFTCSAHTKKNRTVIVQLAQLQQF